MSEIDRDGDPVDNFAPFKPQMMEATTHELQAAEQISKELADPYPLDEAVMLSNSGSVDRNDGPNDDEQETEGPEFRVRDVVDVMPRLWAGINKPGGVGRITKINFDPEEDEYTYNVSYVMGGSESRVDRIYITLVQDDNNKRRQIKGRCKWCPSFIKDCRHNQDENPFAAEEALLEAGRKRKAPGEGDNPVVPVPEQPISAPAPTRRKRQRASSQQPGSEQLKRRRKRTQTPRRSFVAAVSGVDYAALLRVEEDDTYNMSEEEEDEQNGVAESASHKFFGTGDSHSASSAQEESQGSPMIVVPGGRRRAGLRVIEDETQDSDAELVGAVGSDMVAVSTRIGTEATGGGGLGCSQQTAMSQASYAGTVADQDSQSQPLAPPQTQSPGWDSPRSSNTQNGVLATSPPTMAPSVVPPPRTAPAARRSDPSTSAIDRVKLSTNTPHISGGGMGAGVSMVQLHSDILSCCCRSSASSATSAGSDSDDSFINNAPDAHRDTSAAQVNVEYTRRIDGLAMLSVSDKVALYVATYEWMKRRLPDKEDFLTDLRVLEGRLQHLVDNSISLEPLSVMEQRELTAITDAFDRLVDRQELYFQQLERAGFEVLSRLRGTAHREVKVRAPEVSSWPVSINDAKFKLHKGIREFDKSLEEARAMWGGGEDSDFTSDYSAEGAGSDGTMDTRPPMQVSLPRTSSTGSGSGRGRVRDAAKEAGTLVRRRTHQDTDSEEEWDTGPRHREGDLRRGNSRGGNHTGGSTAGYSHAAHPSADADGGHRKQPLAGHGSRPSAPHGRTSASDSKVRRESVHTTSIEHCCSAVVDLVSDDDTGAGADAEPQDTIPDSNSSSASDTEAEMAEGNLVLWWSGKVVRRRTGVRRAERGVGTGYRNANGAVPGVLPNRGGARVRSGVRNSGPLAAGKQRAAASGAVGGSDGSGGGGAWSSRLQRELALVSGTARSNQYSRQFHVSAACISAPSGRPLQLSALVNGAEHQQEGGGGDDARVPHYRRAPAPTVADLGPHVRYDGRITVLEGLLQDELPQHSDAIVETPPVPPSAPTRGRGQQQAAAMGRPPASDASIGRNLSLRAVPRVPSLGGLAVRVDPQPARSSVELCAKDPSRTAASAAGLPLAAALSAEHDQAGLVDILLDQLASPAGALHAMRGELLSVEGHSPHTAWAEAVLRQLQEGSAGAGGTDGSVVAPVRGMSLVAVQDLHHKLATFRELGALQSVARRGVDTSGTSTGTTGAEQRKRELELQRHLQALSSRIDCKRLWAELWGACAEKIGRVKALLSGYARSIMHTHRTGTRSGDRVRDLQDLLDKGVDALIRAHNQFVSVGVEEAGHTSSVGKGSILTSHVATTTLSMFLMHCGGDKCGDLLVFNVLGLLRHRVNLLTQLALDTVEAAKARSPVALTDKSSWAERAAVEREDWGVLNLCFTEAATVQRQAIAALLWNPRLLLAVAYKAATQTMDDATALHPDSMFQPGMQGRATAIGRLLLDTLLSLRKLYTVVNAARTSSTASTAGTRVWSAYEASREQVRGPIAVYPKTVWQSVVAVVQAEWSHVVLPGGELAVRQGPPAGIERIATVNPARWHSNKAADAGCESGSESALTVVTLEQVWGVVVVFTHFLRVVAVSNSNSSSTQPLEKAPRTESAWDLLQGVAAAQVDVDLAPTSGGLVTEGSRTARLAMVLRRVARLSAVWAESSTEGPALYFQLLSRATPRLPHLLPLPLWQSSQSKAALGTVHAGQNSGSVPPLDSRSLALLCLHAHFAMPRVSVAAGVPSAGVSRDRLHQHLLLVVSMLFAASDVPNPYAPGGPAPNHALLTALEEAALRETKRSVAFLLEARQLLKELLHSANTEAYLRSDAASDAANVTAIRAMAAKVPRVFAKFAILALLSAPLEARFQAGMLLCLLVKELAVFFGQDIVRYKLKVSHTAPNAPGSSGDALQQQVLSSIIAQADSVETAVSAVAGSTALGSESTTGTLAQEVDALLNRASSSSNNTGATAEATTLPPLATVRQDPLECLAWFAAIVTFHPLPGTPCTRRSELGTISEADVRQILASHSGDAASLKPVVTILNRAKTGPSAHSNTLRSAVATATVLLCHLQQATIADCGLPLDIPDWASDSMSVVRKELPLLHLHAPLLQAASSIVQLGLAAGTSTSATKSKDSLPVSSAFLFANLVQYLCGWHRTAADLASSAHVACNLDGTAQQLVCTTLADGYQSLLQLLGNFLVVPIAVELQRASGAPSRPSCPSSPVPEVVTRCCALLCSLAASVKNQDISSLNYTAAINEVSPSGSDVATFRKLQARKPNATAGCLFALCRALGETVDLLLQTASSSLRSLSGSGGAAPFHSALTMVATLTEVADTLNKVESLASAGGANLLLGSWLRVAFWQPVLAAIQLTPSAEVTVLVPHLSSLLTAWVGCALVSEASPALTTVAQEIDLPGFTKLLASAALRLVDALRAKCAGSGGAVTWSSISRLSPAELQCLRLAELYAQAAADQGGTTGSSVRKVGAAFLSSLGAGHTSEVLQCALQGDCVNSVSASASASATPQHCNFPVSFRAAFEACSGSLVAAVVRCIQYLTLCAFRCGDDPSKAKHKSELRATVHALKGFTADLAYAYRGTAAPVGAANLRTVSQLPRMVSLDLVDRFVGDVVLPDMITLVDGIFQRALVEHARLQEALSGRASTVVPSIFSTVLAHSTAAQALWEANSQALLEHLPKYILMASDTPYSTRMTAWRALMLPLFLSSTTCPVGRSAIARDSANTGPPAYQPATPLTESSMGELPFFWLLVWSLTLAIPAPEVLVRLESALTADSTTTIRDEFTRLVTQTVGVPIKVSTAWKLFKILVEIVRCSRPPGQTGQGRYSQAVTGQDPQLGRFKQYLWGDGMAMGGKIVSSAAALGAGARLQLCNPTSELWTTLHSEAQSALNQRILQEQGRMAVQANSTAVASTTAAMTVLPWSSVKAALMVYNSAFEEALTALCESRGVPSPGLRSDETAVPSDANLPVMGMGTAQDRSTVSVMVTSAVAMTRLAADLVTTAHDLSDPGAGLLSDAVRQRLLARLQHSGLCCGRALPALRRPTAAVAGEEFRDAALAWQDLLRRVLWLCGAKEGGGSGDGAPVALAAVAERAAMLLSCLRAGHGCSKAGSTLNCDVGNACNCALCSCIVPVGGDCDEGSVQCLEREVSYLQQRCAEASAVGAQAVQGLVASVGAGPYLFAVGNMLNE